jgi:hypothetical protein
VPAQDIIGGIDSAVPLGGLGLSLTEGRLETDDRRLEDLKDAIRLQNLPDVPDSTELV